MWTPNTHLVPDIRQRLGSLILYYITKRKKKTTNKIIMKIKIESY